MSYWVIAFVLTVANIVSVQSLLNLLSGSKLTLFFQITKTSSILSNYSNKTEHALSKLSLEEKNKTKSPFWSAGIGVFWCYNVIEKEIPQGTMIFSNETAKTFLIYSIRVLHQILPRESTILRINEYKQAKNEFKVSIFSPLKRWDAGAFAKVMYFYRVCSKLPLLRAYICIWASLPVRRKQL